MIIRTDDFKQAHISNRAFDVVIAVLDIFNAPEISEKIFKIILELSGNGSLLIVGYKRYLKRQGKIQVVNDYESKEKDFRTLLGKFFHLRTSHQNIYPNSSSSEIVITEIQRTPFSTYLQNI